MKKSESGDIKRFCLRVRESMLLGDYEKCLEDICYGLYHYPHAPEPHNLMGILLEKQSNHLLAMKHFRAALDLDPTYEPAKANIAAFANFNLHGQEGAFTYDDCLELCK